MNLKSGKIIQFISALLLTASCSTSKKIPTPEPVSKPVVIHAAKPVLPVTKSADDVFFEWVYKNDLAAFDKIFQHKTDWNLQIIYTEVKHLGGGKIKLIDHYFNKGGAGYFYPASAIKLPLALLALQKINELKNKGIMRNTTMLTGSAFSGQTEVYNDPNTPTGKPSIEQYIKRAMLVNDNDACNRLYEFLGQEYINAELINHGYANAEILHRVGINLTEDENRHTNPISFYDSLNRLLFTQPAQYNRKTYQKRNDVSGKGYEIAGKLIRQPMDMSSKNIISLENLHEMVISLFYPASMPNHSLFNITEDERLFLQRLMGEDPGESVFPFYNDERYNGYTKYIYFGGEKYNGRAIRSFNTSGTAYGQMTDAALIKDPIKNIEFLVSATVYCNSDGVINDDKYDYNTTGLPVLKALGKAIYDHELRKKQ